MNTFLRALLAGVFAITLLAGCNKSDDAVDNMKEEMGEALDATKDAAGAVAEETKEVVTDAASDAATATKKAAAEAKEEEACVLSAGIRPRREPRTTGPGGPWWTQADPWWSESPREAQAIFVC